MRKFEPIAIIGQGCVFPGCATPEELWQMVYTNQVNISAADPDSWRVTMNDVIIPKGEVDTKSRAWHNKGGYIRDFESFFDPGSFDIDETIINDLDPVFKWSFYAAQYALKDAGYAGYNSSERTGLIMGNLSYPTRSLSQYFEEKHLHRLFPEWKNPSAPVNDSNRFMSGLPAILTARAIGIKGDAFALDAACASSLYAVKLGCDALVNGEHDMMVVGGVCASDQLFLHVGFTALNALSPSGGSRPFHKDADGLIPSEGAGFIVIKRLKDAVEAGDTILGVLRGIGLSNDGKQGGFLSPAQSGQVRSMKQALEASGIQPEQLRYIECHATGTATGDSIELKSMQEVYGKAATIHLGSLKGNIGHSITASGIGSIIKVLAAMKHKTLPPSPNAFPLNESFTDTIFSVGDEPIQWTSEKNRIAGISNFGFGGNNAHVLLEEWNPETNYGIPEPAVTRKKVAVIGVELQTERIADATAYLRILLDQNAKRERKDSVAFHAKALSSPPSDLKHALGQQLLMLHTAKNLVDRGIKLNKAQTGVFIGMGADTEINRYGFRKRLREMLRLGGVSEALYEADQIEESICPILNAPGVLGTMPNIPANRINHHFNFSGTGFTVSCEELSGIKALEVALKSIQTGELESALVGAVDMSDEFVHREALSAVRDIQHQMANAAVVLALKSYDQALADGDTILCTIAAKNPGIPAVYSVDKDWIFSKIGYSHASSGLIAMATAVLLSHHRLQLNVAKTALKPILEATNGFAYDVGYSSLFGGKSHFSLFSEPLSNCKTRTTNSILIHCYSGRSKQELLTAIKGNSYSENEKYRLGIVSDSEHFQKHRELAIRLLESEALKPGWLSPNIHYSTAQITGEIAFAFTGAASAYPKMGKALLEEFPGLTTAGTPCFSTPAFATDWMYESDAPEAKLPYFQLAGSSLMCQIHAHFTKHILGIQPDAAIGLSSGETNAMFALGVWEGMDDLLRELYESELYTSALGVHFNAVKVYWGLAEDVPVSWVNWRILAPVEDVKTLLKSEEKAYMAIVNTKNDCVIGGDTEACDRIIDQLHTEHVMPLHHDIAIHCKVVMPFEAAWRKLHTRKVYPVAGIRFYSNYLDGVYKPTTESVADALTGQAVQAIDFPKIVEKAWEDGVRIFIEHGPRNSLSLAIHEILKGKEFVAVSMDRFGQSGAMEALRAATELWSIGVPVNLEALKARQQHSEASPALEIEFPLRMPAIIHPKSTVVHHKTITHLKTEDMKIMERAPQFAIAKRKKAATETIKSNNESGSEPQLEAPVRNDDLPATRDAFHEMRVEEARFPVSDSILDLFQNQHSLMTEVHDSFLKTQLQAQQDYIQLMNTMMDQVMNMNGDPDSIETIPEYVVQPYEMAAVTEVTEEDQLPDIVVETSEPETKPETIETSMPSSPISEPENMSNKDEQFPELPGPKFSRAQLEILASGKISSVFGPLFEQQDQYAIQVRMPEPPLLLCDRVTGIDAEPGTLGLGTIYTETDVKTDSWYLHNNRMPPGIFIEAGQADLLLISYLGIDFVNKGERAYRLLGCELTFYGELPKPGETLKYDIHVDGYAKSGETTLFFFHYDCHINDTLRISVRSGQAGFFSRKELDESKGVIWDPETAEYTPDYSFEYKNATKKTAFSPAEIEAYTLGNMVECFGPELDWTETHTRSPRSQGGYQNFIKNITKFDLHGGPAGRGYLRSETIVSPDDWYFKGHFKNDECMPGTLMADACLQMMAFFMVGAGLTLKKDGWRFEPVMDYKCKFICRGQVIPESKKVVYEIFVDEIVDGDYPAIYAHVLATVDGNKAFLCERSALRLVPDWPLATMPHLLKEDVPDKKIATYKGFRFGHESLINCALGNAEHAFGPEINYYNGVIRSPRLPGPPYHFMTRIQEYKVEPGNYKNDPYVVAAYDIPENAWYFDENGRATMPYAVLMEVALQPCGWFSTFVCQYDIKGKDLVFRNLDGNAVQHRTLVPGDGTIITKTALSGVSIMGEVIIVKFNVVCSIEGEEVFTMDTVFGFFDTESMKNQKGLTKTDEETANVMLENNMNFNVTSFPAAYFSASGACLPASKLLMIDSIAAYYPNGGKYGRGYIKAEKEVRKGEWFFKAHFFQDPVQPGSLGIEAMIQLIQFYMLHEGLHKTFKDPVFEPIAIKEETEWHYRGQVTPDKKLIAIDFDVKEIIEEKEHICVFGEARLWVDGLKIYYAPRIGMRIGVSAV